ncbi:hypothetical protein [Slackia isoflavoniconvertens]|uniref:hypothetical protein n=1 Tax=Slackia isoflavoniconvertens TaxID=572010 RepID=UPI003F9A40EA
MDCQSLYDEFVDKALAEIKLSKKFAGANEFNSGFLFGTDDCNYAIMKQTQRNWSDAAPGLFADFARKLASGHSIETFDLPSTSRWESTGFGYIADGRKHACVMLWPSIDHSPLNHTKSNSMFWALELVESGEVDDVYLVWLADEANVKLCERLGYWYESFSPRGIMHVSATDWFERTFGKEEADRLADVAGKVRTEGRLIQGFTVAALPTEHEIGSFRRECLSDYEAVEIPLIRCRLMGRGMSEHDVDILARNIQRKDLFEILFGQASFAVSFLSSEWRYRLNTLSENVEQTGTVAGYIKAIEQMMFDLLPLWADRDYNVAFGAVKAWNPAVPLTSALLAEKDKEATLGPLAYLFASYQHEYFNARIYDPGIDYKSFRELLFERLRSFMDDTRNGKLHKSNFYDLGKVREIRDEVLDIMFMLLGGLRLDEEQLKYLDGMRAQGESSPDDLTEMAKALNEGVDGLSVGSFENAHLIAIKHADTPPLWSLALSVFGKGINIQNNHYYSPLRGLSQEEELDSIDRLFRRYLSERCASDALAEVLTEYVVFNVKSKPFHVPLR